MLSNSTSTSLAMRKNTLNCQKQCFTCTPIFPSQAGSYTSIPWQALGASVGIGTHLDLGKRRQGQLQRSFLLLLGVMEMARMCQRGASACVLWIKPQLGSKFPFGLSCPSPGKAGEKTPKPQTLPYFAAAGQLGLQTLGATPLSCCRGENPAETPVKALRGPCAGAGSVRGTEPGRGRGPSEAPAGSGPRGGPAASPLRRRE